MLKLSNGDPSTLASYRKLSAQFFGEGSAQVEFIDLKIKASPGGADEEVVMPEGQLRALLGSLQQRILP